MKYDYDLLCIGLGPAGMAVSIMGSEMGLNVCAIERHKIGGECMNCGCIPSKALLQIARFRHNVSKLPLMELSSVPMPEPQKLFDKIQRDIKFINEKKTVKMFDKVDLILGEGSAEFVDSHTVKVGDKTVTAKRIFIAAGTKPMVLPIPGMDDIDYLTNETIFTLDKVPKSLVVLGGGAIACEMAQAYARLGSDVKLVQRSKHILSKNDAEAAELLEKSLGEEGIELITGDTVKAIEKRGDDIVCVTNGGKEVVGGKVLAAWGRSMDYAALKPENAGVEHSSKGFVVNKYLQTSQKHIFAVGDCNGYHQFSHAAMHQGMIALMNSMMPPLMKMDFCKFAVPYTIFTEPQVSAVAMSEEELKAKGKKYEVHYAKYEDYGAAIAEEVKTGFVKVFVSRMGRIYGAVIVGEGSGEMINEWALAVQKKIRLHDIMMLQHSFPTMGFLTKRVSEMWMMSKMKSEKLKSLCRFMFRL